MKTTLSSGDFPVFKTLLTVVTFFIFSVTANAADKAIIVFDASGSMWGQVEGQTKIAIAKKTLNQLVKNWDENKELGLVAYGHRRKGDCKDIEALVPVGKINKSGMISKVNKINPKGKTPISASISKAADELKYTEDNATVILISDGKETCNADPCETATRLEKLGVNFTAHVIGFDVDIETSKQLKCIADNTGGKYFPADNAEELNEALKKVVEQPKVLTIKAIDEENGGLLSHSVEWKLINEDSEEVISLSGNGAGKIITIQGSDAINEKKDNNQDGNQEEMLSTGKWLVSGISGIYAGEAPIEITGDNDQLLKVNMNKKLPKVTITAPDEATTGTEITVSWDAPDVDNARITLQVADDKPEFYSTPVIFTKNKKEDTMRLPSIKGDYLLRFYRTEDRKTILAERKILLKPAEVTINAPDEAVTGTELDVSWIAPKDSKARINLQMVDDKPEFYTNPVIYTEGKKQNTMRLPSEAGNYVLRWFNHSDKKVVTEHPIKLIEEPITINAPDEAGTGTELEVSWTAPKTSEARINLQMADDKPEYYSNPVIHTKKKKQGTMRLPSEAGNYVLRWFNNSDRKLVVERPIKLIEETITINAPNDAGAGSEIDVSWTAPKTAEARISLQLADEKPEYYSNPSIHTKGKKQHTLRLPSESGDYVLRWYNNSDRKIITEHSIKLTEQEISISAPEEALAGTEVEISWDAPKGLKSFINIQIADEKPNYNSRPYLYTKKKKSDYMRMPSIAGKYTLRWYNSSDRKILAERPITLTKPTVSLNAAEEAIAGTELDLSWETPKGLDSFINIQLADEKPSYNARPYIYTKKKTSEYLRLPSEPGDYMLRWFTRGDNQILAERPIKLVSATIEITAVEEAKAGSEIELFWKAPKGLDSFINIQLADEKPNYNARTYIYTKKKTSGYMKVPEKSGNYMLRWYNRSDQKIIAERPIKIISAE